MSTCGPHIAQWEGRLAAAIRPAGVGTAIEQKRTTSVCP